MRKILTRRIDIGRWGGVGDRVLVYGRRKVGKSFFIRNFTEWDRYLFVKRDGGVLDLDEGREVSYSYLKDLLLSGGGRVVVDEFQRLPDDFLDFLHAYGERVSTVLITSTLWLAQRVFSSNSPLLGIFQRFRMGLIDERDALVGLSDTYSGRGLVEAAVYLREPWLIPMVNGDVRREVPRIVFEEKDTVERLVGEVFREEQRSLKKSYAAILAAVADGRRRSGEISSFLYSRRIIPRDDPSIIQGHLRALVNIGLLEKLRILNRRFDEYVHVSPITDLYFYLDSKYGFAEIEAPETLVEKAFTELLPRHVEHFFRRLLAKLHGMIPAKILGEDHDVDIVLLDFRKIRLVGEVKWRENVGRGELMRTEYHLSKFREARKLLIVPDETTLPYVPSEVEVWTPRDALEASEKSLENSVNQGSEKLT